jgi:hypothetical protein
MLWNASRRTNKMLDVRYKQKPWKWHREYYICNDFALKHWHIYIKEICNINIFRFLCCYMSKNNLLYFRTYPITWATSRITQEDMEIGGHHIPANVSVCLTHSKWRDNGNSWFYKRVSPPPINRLKGSPLRF